MDAKKTNNMIRDFWLRGSSGSITEFKVVIQLEASISNNGNSFEKFDSSRRMEEDMLKEIVNVACSAFKQVAKKIVTRVVMKLIVVLLFGGAGYCPVPKLTY